MNEIIQSIVKDITAQILEEAKGQVKTLVIDSVLPAIDEAVSEFVEQQKAEAEASDSVWVKIRNNLIISGSIQLVWQFVESFVTQVIEHADEIEAAVTTTEEETEEAE